MGVDGSDAGLQATVLAATLAARRRRGLRVVHAFLWPELKVPLGPSEFGPPEGGLANQARGFVDAGLAQAREAVPDLAVVGDVVIGAAAQVLIAEASSATMVVVGDRGLGGFTGLLLGSVALQVAAHSSCPVIVVKGGPARDGDVVVGVDGSRESKAAVGFAFEEASLRGSAVTALHAFRYPATGDVERELPLIYDIDQVREHEAAKLAAVLAEWRERYPDVRVNEVLVGDGAASALVHASQDAGCIVVGSRGLGGFAGLVLGSVSHAVVHHGLCPVAIVR